MSVKEPVVKLVAIYSFQVETAREFVDVLDLRLWSTPSGHYNTTLLGAEAGNLACTPWQDSRLAAQVDGLRALLAELERVQAARAPSEGGIT